MRAAPDLRASPCLDVRVHAHVDEIPAAEWDALLDPDDLLATHRFVKACQDSRIEDASWRHVAVRGADGRLLAVAPLSLVQVRLELLSGTALRGVAAAVRRAWPGFLRVKVLLGGLPVSLGASALRVRAREDTGAVLAAVARAADEVAAELGAPLVAFKEFAPRELEVADALAPHGYFRAESLPACTLELPWDGVDGWLAAMRAGYRRQVRSALAARAAGALRVRTLEGLGDARDRIFALYGEVIERARYRLERLNREWFERVEAAFGPALRTILVEREGSLLAAAILLSGPRTCRFLLVGMDYARARHHQVYPNLVIEVVSEGLRAGAERIELGQTSYAMKGRLGGLPSSRAMYLRHRSPAVHAVLSAARTTLFPRVEPEPRRVFRS